MTQLLNTRPPAPASLPPAARGEKVVICQTAPAVRVAIGEEFDIPAGTATTGQMVSALKMLGFHYVFGELVLWMVQLPTACRFVCEAGCNLKPSKRYNGHRLKYSAC